MKTLFLLLAEHGSGQIPLDACAHLFGLAPAEAAKRANRRALPVPAFRAGSQKSPWLVHAPDLAAFLDAEKDMATDEWRRIQGMGK